MTGFPITRAWAMPSLNTFSIPPVSKLLSRWIADSAVVVDPFARDSVRATYTNDLNMNTGAQYHMDAVEWLNELLVNNVRTDVLLLDPPYSPRQISECYKEAGRKVGMVDTQNTRLYKAIKDSGDKLMNIGGVVVCCGWNSSGMGKARGYELKEILMVAHGGAHNDTIVTVETKIKHIGCLLT